MRGVWCEPFFADGKTTLLTNTIRKEKMKLVKLSYAVNKLGVTRQYIHKELNDLLELPKPVGAEGKANVYNKTDMDKWLNSLEKTRKREAEIRRRSDVSNDWLTYSELSEELGKSIPTLRKAIKENKVKSVKGRRNFRGGGLLFDVKKVREALKK